MMTEQDGRLIAYTVVLLVLLPVVKSRRSPFHVTILHVTRGQSHSTKVDNEACHRVASYSISRDTLDTPTMSSFKRRAPSSTTRCPRGCIPSPANASLPIVSTGIPSLDDVLG